MKNKVVKILTIGVCLLIGICTIQAQTLTNQDMKNLVLVAGYTGVGAFPAVVVARPKEVVIEDKKAVKKIYLLTASPSGWNKKEVTCARGAVMSNDGKYIWLITSSTSDPGNDCVQAYTINFSADGGKTWKSSADAFGPSSSSRFKFLDLDARGNGHLAMWVNVNEGSEDAVPLSDIYMPSVSGFFKINPGRLADGESLRQLPSPSRGNIAQITLNNFAGDNANTLESKKTWLEKLAKTKETKRREMAQ